MARLAFILGCLCSFILLQFGQQAHAWSYQGHEVVGAIADELIKDNANASKQVHDILNSPLPSIDEVKDQKDLHVFRELSLQQAGPWADCVKAVAHHDGSPRSSTPSGRRTDRESASAVAQDGIGRRTARHAQTSA